MENFRILLTAFIIPFTNLIYLFIEHFCFNSDYISYSIGFCTLFVTIPLYFITALCIPKSILPIKWEIIKMVIITAIFGVVLIILCANIVPPIDDIADKSKLEKYEEIINNLEDYKKTNGTYPPKIEDNIHVFKYFHYNTKNADTDYILTVGNYYPTYNFCSAEKLDGCHTNAQHEKFGKWIKVVYED